MTVFGVILFASVILTSCGGGSPSMNVIKKNPVEGVLKDYIEIVDQPYKIEFEKHGDYPKGMDYQAFINLKFKLIKPFDGKITNGYNKGIDITLKFYDENESQPVSETFGLAGREQGEFEEWLKSGEGERVFKMRGGNSGGESSFLKAADWPKVKYIRIITKMN